MPKSWRRYEEAAQQLLQAMSEELGIDFFEGKQRVDGKLTGTSWELDGKGVREADQAFFIVECRRYTTSRQNQSRVGALAFSILDTGAAGGFIVSPLGLQEGAKKVAASANIHPILMDADASTQGYVARFLNKIFLADTYDTSTITHEVGMLLFDAEGNIIGEQPL